MPDDTPPHDSVPKPPTPQDTADPAIDSTPPAPPQRRVLDLLRDLKQQRLNPRDINTEERQACVQHLGAEGVSLPEIASLLGRSERTIARDRRAIREDQALEHDPKLAGEVAGDLVAMATQCMARIRRITRDKESPPAVRVDGERQIFDILDKMTHRLQTLGFLPSAAQQIEATLTHHLGDAPTLTDIVAEAKRLDGIELPRGTDRDRAKRQRNSVVADPQGGVS